MRSSKAKKIKKITPRKADGKLDKNLYRKLKKLFKKGVPIKKSLFKKVIDKILKSDG